MRLEARVVTPKATRPEGRLFRCSRLDARLKIRRSRVISNATMMFCPAWAHINRVMHVHCGDNVL
jgi:hypothetical protein